MQLAKAQQVFDGLSLKTQIKKASIFFDATKPSTTRWSDGPSLGGLAYVSAFRPP
jgi:hypothetical protein